MNRYAFHFLLFAAGLSFLVTAKVSAQSNVCATDEIYRQHAAKNPAMVQLQKQADARWDARQRQVGKTEAEDTNLVVIPVVFHVMYNTTAGDISDNLINLAIAQLNIDYRGKNADTISIRKAFRGLKTDAHIQFRLANQDPYGHCSSGIDRVKTTAAVQATDAVKQYADWNNQRYLNIWVVESINSAAVQGGTILGYSAFPWDAVTNGGNDGIVVDYHYIGLKQRTLTHEVGHYLGLYHTFQDGCSNDQKLEGDHVDDTPPVASASFGYNTSANTCHTDNPDQLDMIENYMDYADYKFLFTPGQVYRMRMIVKGMRARLISDSNVMAATVICKTGLAEATGNSITASVFPNPASQNFNISIESDKHQQGDITITDITGKTVFSKSITFEEGGQVIALDKNETNITKAGLYFISIRTADGITQKKLIME